MPIAILTDRAVIRISGADAEHFLQNLITTDLDGLAQGEARPGALLTPQGKILFDFLVSRDGEGGFLLDCPAGAAEDFMRRLTLYKLRAKVDISLSDQMVVTARWQDDSSASHTDSTVPGALRDRRFPDSTPAWRGYGDAEASADADAWRRFRIAAGIAESGDDYALGEAFPHDVLLDQTGGVGFRKGCYVGQEVVSRMHHRGTARRRILKAEADRPLPAPGTSVTAGDRTIGTLGGVAGQTGLALVRIDRVRDALDAGTAIEAGGVALRLTIPGWASFGFPESGSDAENG